MNTSEQITSLMERLVALGPITDADFQTLSRMVDNLEAAACVDPVRDYTQMASHISSVTSKSPRRSTRIRRKPLRYGFSDEEPTVAPRQEDTQVEDSSIAPRQEDVQDPDLVVNPNSKYPNSRTPWRMNPLQDISLTEARSLTRLETFTLKGLQCQVEEIVYQDGGWLGSLKLVVTRGQYNRLMRNVIGKEHRIALRQSTPNRLRVERLIDAIWEGLDWEMKGSVSISECLAGLSPLCAGSRREKVDAAFDLFGYYETLSLDDMKTYLWALYTVLFVCQPDVAEKMGVSSWDLAIVTAEDAFEAGKDTLVNGCLPRNEFHRWYSFEN